MSRIDLEQGRRRNSDAGTVDSAEEDDGSLCFSDADEGGSCYSQFYSTAGGSYDEYSFSCVLDPEMAGGSCSRRASSVSECSVEIEAGVPEVKVHLTKAEKDCRICHLGLESSSHEAGVAIELGCSCKDDLGAAHKNCAETWFKIKGNKICEICNSIAKNVVGVNEVESTEQPNETENTASASAVSAPVTQSEPRNFWQGHRFLNFLLACMVFAFVISWLFHFNVPSS